MVELYFLATIVLALCNVLGSMRAKTLNACVVKTNNGCCSERLSGRCTDLGHLHKPCCAELACSLSNSGNVLAEVNLGAN